MNLKKSLLVASLALTGLANAQEFSLTGEFRPRYEFFGNGQSSTATSTTVSELNTSVRAALNAKYKSESYTVYLGVQEVFDFGDRTQIENDNSAKIRFQEAWADIKEMAENLVEDFKSYGITDYKKFSKEVHNFVYK